MGNPAASIDYDRAEVTRTIRIDAPPSVVWATLTHPAHLGQWFGQASVFPDGVHIGAHGTFFWKEYGTFPVRIEEFEPIRRFAFTWGRSTEPDLRTDNSTTAVFELWSEAAGQRTKLTVVESGFAALDGRDDPRDALRENAHGWTEELDQMVGYIAELLEGVESRVDGVGASIVRSVRVNAPQTGVWDALTDPAQIEAWWGHPARFPQGFAAGAAGTFTWVDHGEMPILITAWEPSWRWSFLWGELGDTTPGQGASLIEFNLTPVVLSRDESEESREVTVLTVIETLPAPAGAGDDTVDESAAGWNAILAAFADHVAAGQPAAAESAAVEAGGPA